MIICRLLLAFLCGLSASLSALPRAERGTIQLIWLASIPGTGNIPSNINSVGEIKTNISIGTSGTGVFTVFQNLTDSPGGTEYLLTLVGNGTIDI